MKKSEIIDMIREEILNEAATIDNKEAGEIINKEGMLYAVSNYANPTRITDAKTAKLWGEAKKAFSSLYKLYDYLETDIKNAAKKTGNNNKNVEDFFV